MRPRLHSQAPCHHRLRVAAHRRREALLVDAGLDEILVELRGGDVALLPCKVLLRALVPRLLCGVERPIKKGTFVFTYGGELEQEIRKRDSVYVYDTPAETV